jgi:hypothetical protein
MLRSAVVGHGHGLQFAFQLNVRMMVRKLYCEVMKLAKRFNDAHSL